MIKFVQFHNDLECSFKIYFLFTYVDQKGLCEKSLIIMPYLVILIRNAGFKKIPDWIAVFYVNYRCSFKKQILDQNSLYQDADWKCLSEKCNSRIFYE